MIFEAATLARRGLLHPGPPSRVLRQLLELRRWGFGLPGELRQAAARNPGRVAVIDDDGFLTYAALLDLSQRLTAVLDVEAGDRVGLLSRNSAAMVAAMVAVASAGADPVLLNTGLSAPQLSTVARDQGLRLILHSRDFTPAGVPARCLDDLVAPPPSSGLTPPPPLAPSLRPPAPSPLASGLTPPAPSPLASGLTPPAPSPLASGLTPPARPPLASGLTPPARPGRTIVLTSGTTGLPKGAQRPTPGGFGPLASIIDRIPLRAGDSMLIAAPLFHTWGLAGLQIALALRATVVLRRRFSPADAIQAMIRERCSALIAVPVMLQGLMELPPGDQPPLSVVAVSGSALPGGLAIRFMDRYGDILYNLYGSTEASWASIATPADLRAAPGTAGRPPHGTRIAVLDPDGRPLPPGEPGRLFVGNEMLFEGYTNGAGKETRDGLLATGDLGHVDDAGRVFVDGREDDMIVSGGENVFPSEVENLLADLPGVREVAVIGVPDPTYGQRLAAYLVRRPGVSLDADAVRDHVREFRARFCVPRDVVFLDALPRNATGKVLKRELPSLPDR
ncbi:AMP-binding protein [Actinoplanes sp. NPDC051411]|uniref:AMP-binding protein n=1 Tax=Actinoplanes sp. NPDC051411 TaxID=3155522 RepID=UPI003423FDDC